jgi:ribosomal protein L11 methyltransferase
VASDRLRVPGTWYRVRASLPRTAEDLALGALHRAGSTGSATLPAGPRRVVCEAWFESAAAAAAGVNALRGIAGAKLAEGGPEPVRDDGWLDASSRPRPPLLAGRFAVFDRPPTEPPTADALGGRELLVIPASRAFGTGEHPTTRLCLELLSERVRPGDELLDLGTGSGILAIAAARLGARRVLALDIDSAALEVAAENVAAHGVADRVRLAAGSWTALAPGTLYDGAIANIHRTALVRGARSLVAHLRPGACAVLSGFLRADEDKVERAWSGAGLHREAARHDGDWVALAVRAEGDVR